MTTTTTAWAVTREYPTGQRNGYEVVTSYELNRPEISGSVISEPQPVSVELVAPNATIRRDAEGYLRVYVRTGRVARGMDVIDVLDLDEAIAAGAARIATR